MEKNPETKKIVRIKTWFMDQDKILGRGTFSTVYYGYHYMDKKMQVAIKMISIRQRGRNMKEQIWREVSILKSLSFPDIIQLYDVYEWGDKIYLVLEYCDGDTLDKYLPLSMHQVQFYGYRIAKILEYLASKNIVHHDIKPSNIIFTNRLNQDIKLIDFGLADIYESPMDTQHGTPLYMAPEILLGQFHTCLCDIWSFGIVLYQMLHNQVLFQAQNLDQLKNQIQDGIGISNLFQKPATCLDDLLSNIIQYEDKRWDISKILGHDLFQYANFIHRPILIPMDHVAIVWIHSLDSQDQCTMLSLVNAIRTIYDSAYNKIKSQLYKFIILYELVHITNALYKKCLYDAIKQDYKQISEKSTQYIFQNWHIFGHVYKNHANKYTNLFVEMAQLYMGQGEQYLSELKYDETFYCIHIAYCYNYIMMMKTSVYETNLYNILLDRKKKILGMTEYIQQQRRRATETSVT